MKKPDDEEFDEKVECFKCKGHGAIPRDFNLIMHDPCPKCQGQGEVDWTKNLVNDYDSMKPDILKKFLEHNIQTIKRWLVVEAEKLDFTLEISFDLRHIDDEESLSQSLKRKGRRK